MAGGSGEIKFDKVWRLSKVFRQFELAEVTACRC